MPDLAMPRIRQRWRRHRQWPGERDPGPNTAGRDSGAVPATRQEETVLPGLELMPQWDEAWDDPSLAPADARAFAGQPEGRFAVPTADRAPAGSVAPAHVVVADPAPELRGVYRELLRRSGYRVSLADPAVDIETIKRLRPDVLLIDPGTDRRAEGWRLLERLRADPATAGLPVVVCTGAARRVREAGPLLAKVGAELLLKPFDASELLGALAATTDPRGRRSQVDQT